MLCTSVAHMRPLSGCHMRSGRGVAAPRTTALGVRVPARSRRSSSALAAVQEKAMNVSDVMTAGKIYTCSPEDTVDDVLQMLVTHRVTGLPVVDAGGQVVGVVSDYDLLALDKLGKSNASALFPSADETWQAFNAVKTLLAKSSGKKVQDVMTKQPITTAPDTELDEAARVLLTKKIHRLPVVDREGKLVGVLSRGNIVKAALALRTAAKAAEQQ